ncbi:MAG: alpha/beta fold hydrolase, partial [Alphaproteobacteria bacterium]|nr:alpha/beta fold hydrolase [Alphaproteobacteria bacterium]
MSQDGMTRQDVGYYSDGLKITAHLYRPESWQPGDAPLPAVVCLTGYTGRKNVATIDIPRRLAREGFVALAPDYRGYGEAEGERGRHRPLEQAQNTYDAVTYLETVDGVDAARIGVYGSSFGAANAVWAAAFDPRMKVVVSAVGVHDGERWLRSVRSAYDWFNFRDQVRDEARRRVVTGEKTMIYRYDIYPNDPGAVEKPTLNVEEHGAEDVTHVDMESVEACLRYKPDWVVDRISPRPVLFFAAEYDSIVPPEEVVATYERCCEPKKLVELPGARHNHVYQ